MPLAKDQAVLWSAEEACRATGGTSAGHWQASGVSIDSRMLVPGDLFIALKGERVDGHDFVRAALSRGAAAAMISRPVSDAPAECLLRVGDIMTGLNGLASAARARSRARIVAVTGSVGKTGTKELIARALQAHGPTTASGGNLNNQIGAPLSLARMPRDAAYGVFELGMNHAGEIRPLSALVRPHVALITLIAPAHLAFFPNLDAIADAKAEIFTGLETGGAAVLNRDDPSYERLKAAALDAGARVISFGGSAEATARLIDWQPDATGAEVRALIGERVIRYRLRLFGRHLALNSVAALAAAQAAGADPARAAAAFEQVTPLSGRGARHVLALAGGTLELIDESYNASPAAMRAAIATLADATPGPSGRRIAALGDMRELGSDAERLHTELRAPLEAAGIDLVFTAGPLMAALDAALPANKRGGHRTDAEALAPLLRAQLRSGDVLLVKGSLGSRMGVIVAQLLGSNLGGSSPHAL
jgi:UDP-N-acetylmuramoyl-tripeptide--D-alanyl-D-alanine ligase